MFSWIGVYHAQRMEHGGSHWEKEVHLRSKCQEYNYFAMWNSHSVPYSCLITNPSLNIGKSLLHMLLKRALSRCIRIVCC